jgi:hypothetical protein
MQLLFRLDSIDSLLPTAVLLATELVEVPSDLEAVFVAAIGRPVSRFLWALVFCADFGIVNT